MVWKTPIAGFMALALALCSNAPFARAAGETDPFASPIWKDLAARYFGDTPYVFDERVKVAVPHTVENQAQVPVTADARALGDVKKIIVFADRNPIQLALAFEPQAAEPYVGLRIKVEQSTPVRAAALTADGTWHVGGIELEAAGGGCTAPAMARAQDNWSETVGQAQGRIWTDAQGYSRVRFRIRHPMDTGLAKDNTPAYYIDDISLSLPSGALLARVQPFEPLSEDPTLTLLLRLPPGEASVNLDSRDNNGGVYRAVIPARWPALPDSRPPS